MNATVEQLQGTRSALQEALQAHDWEAVGRLDLECRQVVNQALLDTESDTETLVGCMQDLLALYRELIGTCSRQRNELAEGLCESQRSRKGAQVYQLFG